jgi:hypothetical protein
VPTYEHDTHYGKHDGARTLEYQGYACVRCRKGIHEAEQTQIDADQQPADGRDHETSARHDNKQPSPKQEQYGEKYAGDSLE